MFSEYLEAFSRRNLHPFSTSNQKKLMEHAGLVVIGQRKKNRGRHMGPLKISLF